MKKTIIILTVFSLCMSLTALSQKTRVGVTGGIDAANLSKTIGGADRDGEYKIGLVAGFQLEVPLGKKNKFSFQPDLHYIQKGTSTIPTTPIFNKIYTALRYVELAPNFVRNCNREKGTFYFGGGPYIGLPLPSKEVTRSAGSPGIETNITFGNAVANNYRGVDYGGNVVMGYRMKNGIFVSANYIQGIQNLIPDEKLALPGAANDKVKNIGFAIRVGYLFNNTPKEKK